MSYRPTYQRGEWKAVCDICGREYKASELRKRWDNFMVCQNDWEPRQPQDFVRGVADYQAPPYTRPETSDVFLPVTYQIYVQPGNYVYSGQSSKLTKSATTRLMVVTQGSYTYTGEPIIIGRSRNLMVTSGTYSYTGDGINYYRGRYMPAVFGSYIYTGSASTMSIGKGLSVVNGTYTYTGEVVTLTFHQINKVLTAIQGTYTYTGEAVTLVHGKSISVTQGSYTYTGEIANLTYNHPITYATWNPADNNGLTLSNGNLTATGSSGNRTVRSTISKSSGKWYIEYSVSAATGTTMVGIANSTYVITSYLYDGTSNGEGYTAFDGKIYFNNVASAFGAAYTVGDVIGLALDASNGNIQVYKNNVLQGTVTNVITAPYYIAFFTDSPVSCTANFGATAFTYTPPAGYNSGLYN